MRTALGQASPNPVWEGLSTIPFVMSSPGPVKLRLLDLAGREVRLLVDKRMEAGAHSVHWDGRDNQGHLVKAGTYIYQLRAPGFESSRKLVRLR
jgi:flagellar hook assembly protein FlgD